MILLGSGGPVVLKMSITNRFDWAYKVSLNKGSERQEFEKSGLQGHQETVMLAQNADELREWLLVVVMTLVPGSGTTTHSNVKAELTVGESTQTPHVIDLSDEPVNIQRNFIGTRLLQ